MDPEALRERMARLRPAETVVRARDGSSHVVRRGADGAFVVAAGGAGPAGDGDGFMVVDNTPDPHPAHVHGGVYIGSQDAAANLDALRENRVTLVLNAGAQLPNFHPDAFEYMKLPLLDVPETDIFAHFDAAADFIARSTPESSVLVHCNAGVSRSATLVAAYLIREAGHTPQSALELIRRSRPQARPNDGFMDQLGVYHRVVTERRGGEAP